MKSICKHWGLHISTNINCLGAVLDSFWAVWRGLLWCPKTKLRLWRFPRYWRFNKQYHGGYQLICLISRPILITSRRDWYRLKGLLKGFTLDLRPWESSKNWWRYGRMKFVTPPQDNIVNNTQPSLLNEIPLSNLLSLNSDPECHDLAKRLSYYLYFFSFLFLLDLLHKRGIWESSAQTM